MAGDPSQPVAVRVLVTGEAPVPDHRRHTRGALLAQAPGQLAVERPTVAPGRPALAGRARRPCSARSGSRARPVPGASARATSPALTSRTSSVVTSPCETRPSTSSSAWRMPAGSPIAIASSGGSVDRSGKRSAWIRRLKQAHPDSHEASGRGRWVVHDDRATPALTRSALPRAPRPARAAAGAVRLTLLFRGAEISLATSKPRGGILDASSSA